MSLESRLAELKKDLLSPAGPAISTNRSYPFAIFQYFPTEEYEARSKLGSLAEELRVKGWKVRTVDLFEQLEAYLAEQEDGELVEAIIEEENSSTDVRKGLEAGARLSFEHADPAL